MAATVGILAARITTYAVWRLDFFDDPELLIDDSMDRHETTQIREAGSISDALAAVFLDSLAPLRHSRRDTDRDAP
ncbi:hypothetical protein ASG12_07630 [Williamsia sp. Leaf354]|uniref:hypothetical protein n=1 Tax=Williamsia sp. Leaf354 TaxID=1736349 RepID=UPI0006F7C2E0|nr:hypothetical protein [Williamsia sp. Leaf354]KQS00724.1 hypothetical protein ASG12_07630 [Williamsia sp. Leaf354]